MTSKTTNAIELSARFAEERQRILAQNVANVVTPDYHDQHLDPKAFQRALRAALETADRKDGYRLKLRSNAQVSTLPNGRIAVRPAIEPAPNILFHDGTNARLERLMSAAAKNALYYQWTTSLLGKRHDGLLTAIRGRI